jgi:pimeloyl-ACP methyl ester carboxylesterase
VAFVDNAGVRICYKVVGVGRPLVLHHGYSDSLTTWDELGYVSAFAERRQVIVLDARGHGGSDKPHDPMAYSWKRRADDVIAVLDAEQIETADFYGASMGGSVGIALATRAPSRFSSLIIGAADDATLPGQGFAELLALGAPALMGVWEQQGELSAGLRQRLLANDLVALAALANRPRPDESQLTDAFREAAIPRMLIAGELDPGFADIAELAASLPEARFVALPGLNHYESFRCADVAVPHLISFLDDITTTE